MNRVWMITGAGRGLGRAFAEEAVRNGDRVIATLRKPSEEPFFQSEEVLPVFMDVTDKEAVRVAVKAGVEKFGRIDVLVNNAGYGMNDAFEEMTDEELRDLMEANFFGTANVSREVLPVMREQGSGMILNLSSIAGLIGMIGSTGYCSAKFAVAGLSEALNEEVREFGIQVSCVHPGAFRTDFRDLSSMKRASGRIDAYKGSGAHALRDSIASRNHQQEGDPAKAASFIYRMVDSGKLPKRIFIGKQCCAMAREYLEGMIRELDTYIEEAQATDFE